PLRRALPAAVTLAFLALSALTATAANMTSTAAGGNWSAPGTWVGGVVPTAADDVTIASTATVTIDLTTATCLSLTVGQGTGGILQYVASPASTLTVVNSVTVATGATFQTSTSGSVTTHLLSVGGDLTNNGTINFSPTTTRGTGLTFTGAANNTFGGTG